MPHDLSSKDRGTQLGSRSLPAAAQVVTTPPWRPLLQMRACWSLRAHRSYLHAANFHWLR